MSGVVLASSFPIVAFVLPSLLLSIVYFIAYTRNVAVPLASVIKIFPLIATLPWILNLGSIGVIEPSSASQVPNYSWMILVGMWFGMGGDVCLEMSQIKVHTYHHLYR
jgi:C4-dicarboxylate transporter